MCAVCGTSPRGRLFKDESIPVMCCRTSSDNHINDFLHCQLKSGSPEGVFFTALPSFTSALRLRCNVPIALVYAAMWANMTALCWKKGLFFSILSRGRKHLTIKSLKTRGSKAGKIDERVEMIAFILVLSEDKGEVQRLKQEERVRMRKRKGMGGHTVFRELTSE